MAMLNNQILALNLRVDDEFCQQIGFFFKKFWSMLRTNPMDNSSTPVCCHFGVMYPLVNSHITMEIHHF